MTTVRTSVAKSAPIPPRPTLAKTAVSAANTAESRAQTTQSCTGICHLPMLRLPPSRASRLPQERHQVVLLLLVQRQLQQQVEQRDGVLQGQAAAVVHVRRVVLDAAQREALDRPIACLILQEALQCRSCVCSCTTASTHRPGTDTSAPASRCVTSTRSILVAYNQRSFFPFKIR